MDKLDNIINEGQRLNDGLIVPTINQRLALKVSILNVLSKMSKDIFVMNRQFFYWKQRLVSGEISLPDSVSQFEKGEFNEKLTDWLLEPLLIFCNNPEEVAKKIADGLFEKKYKYVRARNDMYPTRLIVDVEFEIAAIINPTNKTISKHADNVELYGANVNMNSSLMLPVFLYDYITPKFNYEQWKSNLEIEPFMWMDIQKVWEKGVSPLKYENVQPDIQKRIFDVVKSEKEGDFIFTGYYTYHMLTNPQTQYNGEYHIYHKNPEELLAKMQKSFDDVSLKVVEEEKVYYFQSKIFVITLESKPVLTIMELDFPINYIKLGVYMHTNFHGLLLFMLLDALKSPIKDYNEKIGYIGYLMKAKNIYLEKIGGDMLNGNGKNGVKNVFEVLQNNSIGPETNPFLDFKKKEFNRELTFFYRPDIQENKDE